MVDGAVAQYQRRSLNCQSLALAVRLIISRLPLTYLPKLTVVSESDITKLVRDAKERSIPVAVLVARDENAASASG
jgi:hypothetical protein